MSNSFSTQATSCIAKSELRPSAKISSLSVRFVARKKRPRNARIFSRGSPIRSSRVLGLIVVKTFSALAPKQTGIDHFFQQRTRSIFCVAEAFLKHVDRKEYGVQSDEVRGFQWS